METWGGSVDFVCLLFLLCACMHVCGLCLEVRGQHTSWFSVCGYQGSNSGQQAWQQAPLFTEPSHWSKYIALDLHHPTLIRKQAFWHSAWSENRILPCSQC